MKAKILLSLILIAVILGTVLFHNMHFVTFDGIRLELPYIVDKTKGAHDITITKIPPDATLLIISNKNIDFDDYKNKVLLHSKSEIVFAEKSLTVNKIGPIKLVLSRLTSSPQSIIVHGTIVNKKLNLTFYGDKASVDEFITALEQLKPSE